MTMYWQRNYTICIFEVLHQAPSKQPEKMNFDYLNECYRIAKLDASLIKGRRKDTGSILF